MKILFQGDSITDAGRNREYQLLSGSSYATMLAGFLGCDHPGQVKCINRGIGGNRVVDLYARWRVDAINLQPDVISILIGVNDVWHGLGSDNGVEADRFEMVYDQLLDYTEKCLPDAKIIIMEPFVGDGAATHEKLEAFRTEVALRAQAAKRVAEKHGAAFVALQSVLDEAVKTSSWDAWLEDGVHPNAAGNMLIAKEWMKTFGAMKLL